MAKGIWQNICGSDLVQVCATILYLTQIYWLLDKSHIQVFIYLNVLTCKLLGCLYFYSENPKTFIKSVHMSTIYIKPAYPHAPTKDRATFYSPRNTKAALMSNPKCFLRHFSQRPHFTFFYRPLRGRVSAPTGLPMCLQLLHFCFLSSLGTKTWHRFPWKKTGLISAPNHLIAIFHV